jgi:hypothetical protein
MAIMHLALLVDIQKMEASFQLGYKEDNMAFYIFPTNNLV